MALKENTRRHLADLTIAVVGLGYVGLPLAVEFARYHRVLGFDLNNARIAELKINLDSTGEVSSSDLDNNETLIFTSNHQDLSDADLFIITVPTPIDKENRPDLGPLLSACKLVGEKMSPGVTIVLESTVYPGVTEDICVPVIEEISGLSHKIDFWIGYSPERVNPGDSRRRLADIVKVVSGDVPDTCTFLSSLYAQIIKAGVYAAPTIKVAEAAKVIENTQRDLNIALINELAMLFNHIHLDIYDVLDAAKTKWNFLDFSPGLVGGHCIGVDPYYLTYKAQAEGFDPKLILSGRSVNDGMAGFLADRVRSLADERFDTTTLRRLRVLFLGCTFKENCPDTRNSQAIRLVSELSSFAGEIDVFDPFVKEGVDLFFGLENVTYLPEIVDGLTKSYEVIFLAVSHDHFRELPLLWFTNKLAVNGFCFDLKNILPKSKEIVRL